ncbi:FAD/FMN-containing dehydrogenases [Klebsormidium nitens]|uniref:D-2-hydroxyglutarate dehydrogenase, mitochondrial n=1 Tax=Klebsormidium nitens TaxID=105231 RepID=A0A1Y1IKY2_KLENI|nr:FAD/FMN-containing dehydrogenases [Klebsormidium nitens]|eukprot:GAQ88748.1 FAD/FMN-containing dehydrogenases [Klebsormidium nitens]
MAVSPWTPPLQSQQWRSYSASAPVPARDPSFAQLTSDDVRFFQGVLGLGGVVTDDDLLAVANTDWMNKYHGKSKLLLRPRTTEQVSRVLAHCHERRLAVVPQGGNSGLVGGSVPLFDEVILNLGAMDRIVSFDEVSGILVCEAGCILEKVDAYLAERGFVFPLDLGAKGSCQIGGNISTNAGGLRLLRYGSLHGNVLGLEVVLADGTVVDTLKTLRKDNTGYDVKQLFVGGEGTLGVVTQAAILTPPKARAVNVALLACASFQDALTAFRLAKQELGEVLSAFEFFDRTCLDLVLKHHSAIRDPLPPEEDGAPPYPFYLLVETAGSNQEHDSAKWDAFLEAASAGEVVQNGTIAQDAGQAAGLWAIREGITESLAKNGVVYKYDFSLPVTDLYRLVEDTQQRIGPLGVAVGYGHLGDGNLHLNVSAPAYSDALRARLEPWVYEWTAQHRGSISAEHGLGQMKPHALRYSKADSAIELMASLKRLLDPRGILNPYKVLPDEADKRDATSKKQQT